MPHGKKQYEALAPRSRFYQGPFGRICPDLEPWIAPVEACDLEEYLLGIANGLMIEEPDKTPGEIVQDPALRERLESDFASNIPAGYTYFGQFVDHDITFDPASTLMRRADPNGLLNFRTPRFDLDNVYGAGPDDQPYLYDKSDKAKMAIGTVDGRPDLPDLPRFNGTALIGDMRNDENAIVSQLQLAFLLAHNTLVDRARAANFGLSGPDAFEMARQTLRWLYQYIVWNDFVRRIAIDEVMNCALKLEKVCGGRKGWSCGLSDLYHWSNQPFMPVEFSVAAYRFGHSMVRNDYQTNNPVRGFGNHVPIFDNSGSSDPDDLRGFDNIKPENCIQWDWFLQMQTSGGPFPQMARKIDTKLANALAFLHEGPSGDPLNVLAFRNLQRGIDFDLPSGTSVARKMCLKPVKLRDDEPDALWYYILREAQGTGGNGLGRVGSNIVCSVFAGLLKGDPMSYVNVAPCWEPDDDPLLESGANGDNRDDSSWTLASIIRLAGLKADGIGFA